MNEPTQSAARNNGAHRAWSLFLFRIAGIPIYLHFTFLLMLAYIGFVEFTSGEAVLGGLGFVLAVFASVGLHELGHALMAMRFGIRTQDIVLYPIGGVARLRSMGEGWQEFWIAIAGPAVNVVIFGVIYAGLKLSGKWIAMDQLTALAEANPESVDLAMPFLQSLAFINMALLVFNMIPAFPMDGGRVLRSILASRMPRPAATALAAKIGQAFALLFMLGGMLYNPMLFVIGIFVFIAAGQESAATQSTSLLSGHKLRDAMITQFETLAHGDSLGRAAELLLSTNQHDFPVIGGSEVIGVLCRRDLITGLSTHGRDHFVAEVMARQFPRMIPSDPLERALVVLRDAGGLPILIFDGEQLVGYIDQENLAEYLMIAQTRPQG